MKFSVRLEQSDIDDKVGSEALHLQMGRIASRVADNPAFTQRVVSGLMDVAVSPKSRLISVDQPFEIGAVGRADQFLPRRGVQ